MQIKNTRASALNLNNYPTRASLSKRGIGAIAGARLTQRPAKNASRPEGKVRGDRGAPNGDRGD